MDFGLSSAQLELQQRTRSFVADEVIPMESDPRQDSHGPSEALRNDLVAKARRHGLLTPHASKAHGGLGLSHVDKAIVFEEAGYSPLGPIALNIHAPDEGNVHLMEEVATPDQKARWLQPLIDGHIRSCFCMTEPPPGAGSDPSMMQTLAVRDGDDYLITGRKWFINGATGAGFAIIMARMEDGSATMFLADMDQPEIVIERQIDAMDSCFTGGHGVVRIDGLRVPATDVLGTIGEGFRYAQIRLAPARLTHCMRWLGQARRAHGYWNRAVKVATSPVWRKCFAPKQNGAWSTARSRSWALAACPTRPSSHASSRTCALSRSMTVRRKCTAGAWPSGFPGSEVER